MTWYDCEIPEFYSETFPKAAKVHKCCECKAPIEVGEKHLYYRMKSDGAFWHERQHMLCRELCMILRDADFVEDCIPFGELKSWWAEEQISQQRGQEMKPYRDRMAAILRRERQTPETKA